jgi:membrane-associated protease RseP (regulator of RpoE activity)
MRLEQEKKKKKKVHAEVKFPLILIHTPFGLTFFDKVARTNAARIYAKFCTYLMPLITGLAIFLFVFSLIVVFSNSAAREGARNAGPFSPFLIPGLNPILPLKIAPIIITAIIIAVFIHEGGHGIVARVYNIKVESTGILLFLGIPVGAFVNIEQEELAKASLKQRSAILTAGPLNNMILATISLIAIYFVISTLTSLSTSSEPQSGVEVTGVNDGSLAGAIGLSKGSSIKTIAGQNVHSIEDLSTLLRSNLGHNIKVTWQDRTGEKITRSVSLPASVGANRGILGILIKDVAPDPSIVLKRYKSAFSSNPLVWLLPPTVNNGTAVPYSDSMASKYESNVLGSSFPIVANMLFWLWFINFNLAIFNALPIIIPLDGSQWYNSLIESKTTSKTNRVKNASQLLSIVMTMIVLMQFVLPWVIK